MHQNRYPWLFLLLLFALVPCPAGAQEGAIAEPIRVFLDCDHDCDEQFIKTEITWVSYMRDRADAHVHVLVADEPTGGGGRRYTLRFIGLKQFTGLTDTLTFTASADDSRDVRRRGMTRTIALGLVPFVARTPAAQQLNITAVPAGANGRANPAAPARDPWNHWTFRVGADGFGNGESQSSFYFINTNASAGRTTEAWKISLGLNGSYRVNTFEYTIDSVETKTRSIRKQYRLNALAVKSIGPHLSAGFNTSLSASTYGNTSLEFALAPALEYNIIPYSESTTRAFTVRYSAGMRAADYREVTIFGETRETRPAHGLDVEYSTTQPWGRVNASVDASQYLHDTSKYSAGVGGNTELRLFKGLSLNLSGDYTLVRDQLSLPGRELTEQEILLQQRQLATNYSYYFSAGVSYRFGSIFNSIVNPRFSGFAF